MSAVELLEGKASMSAEQRKISFFAEPLGTVRSSLAEQAEVSVEFLYRYALVLRVEIADRVAPFRQRQRINRPAIIEIESHLGHQLGQRIFHAANRQTLLSTPQGAIAVFNQSPPSQRTHRSLTLPVPRPRATCISGTQPTTPDTSPGAIQRTLR